MKKLINGLSLFTGYGGIDVALSEYVRPVMYCDIEKYSQAIILSRMDDQSLPFAPVWNDVTTLDGRKLRGLVDIVYGGFPCQDISVAGKGAGLDGERSGLFREIVRICEEASPQFVFLENVPAIRTRGALEVQEALATIGYDTRWTTLSAAEVGANHKRERWFCLATNTNNDRHRQQIKQISEFGSKELAHIGGNGEVRAMANSDSLRKLPKQEWDERLGDKSEGIISNPLQPRLEGQRKSVGIQTELPCTDRGRKELPYANKAGLQEEGAKLCPAGTLKHGAFHPEWWAIEPDVGRVANGVAFRVDRIKALGNGVVPLQAKKAFEILMGLK